MKADILAAMKCVLVLALSLAVLLQTASNQEDLTEEELGGEPTGSPQNEDEPTPPPFEPPAKPSGDVYFAEAFTDEEQVWKTWIPSRATKDGGEVKYDGETVVSGIARLACHLCVWWLGKWELAAPSTEGGFEEDQGLLIPVSFLGEWTGW